MTWTTKRVDQLKQLLSSGLSASQIANELGGVTRNGVIGKVHRLGLSLPNSGGRPASAHPAAPAAPRRRHPSKPQTLNSPVHWRVNVPATDPVPSFPQDNRPDVAPLGARDAIAGLTEHTCRWPEGDPANSKFRFCCAEPVTGSPYCGTHTRAGFDRAGTARADRRSSRSTATHNQERPREPASQHERA